MFKGQIDMWSTEIGLIGAAFNIVGEMVTEFTGDLFDFESTSMEQKFKRRAMQGVLTFNNNIMILLVGAHVCGNNIWGKIFNGSYTDFSS